MAVSPFQAMGWIVQTKLQPPNLRQDLIPRQQLLSKLHQAITSHRLTLISAPAGYGKTTLLATLPHAYPDLSLAWLSLDQGENDPVGFLSALMAALQRLNPACGAITQTVLESLANPAAELRRIVGVLINDVLETLPDSFVLVLEDLHTISEPVVFGEIDYLLERMPPQMHLAIGTRHDPPITLARLRSLEELAELRLDDLRFTLDETSAFLNGQLRLGLSASDLISLHARTEGWAAGLRLFAGSLQHLSPFAERGAFITQLARSSRHIFDLLAEEVLSRQEPTIRAFLLETSILSELTPALCQAVTGRSDAEAILAELYRRNLFLVAVGDEGPKTKDAEQQMEQPLLATAYWSYRYHDLFADFLRQQLAREMAERLPDLHCRAAKAQIVPARAVQHYLAAELWEEAAQTIERIGEQLLQQGLLPSLQNWIRTLPAAVREAHPCLSYLLGVCTLHQQKLAEATACLQQALTGFELTGERAKEGKTLAYLANLAFFQADFPQGLALIERALACPIPPHIRVQILIERARVVQFQGNFAQVDADVASAWDVYHASADEGSLRMLLEGFIQGFMARPGGLDRLEQLCQEGETRAADGRDLLRVVLDEQWAIVHCYRGRINLSLEAAKRALALGQRLGGRPTWSYWSTQVVLLIGYTVHGDKTRVEQVLDHLLPQLKHLDAFPMRGFLYFIARACWLQGRYDDTRRLYQHLRSIAAPASNPVTALFLAMVQGLLEMAEGHYSAAGQVLRGAVSLEAKLPFFNFAGSARVLLAELHLKIGLPEEALAEIDLALLECREQGAPGRILLEGPKAIPALRLALENKRHPALAGQLLETLEPGPKAEPQPVAVPETGETLSIREVEVLRLLAAGASNQEIAETLVLSIHTVKRHVANILAKLNVANRIQASTRARELGIVE